MTNEPVEYTAWDERTNEAEAERFNYTGRSIEPWHIAESYARRYHDSCHVSPDGIVVIVKHTLTGEVTRWRIVVEYDPSYYANPA